MSKFARTLGKVSSVLSVVFTLTGNPILASAFAANAALMGAIGDATQKRPGAQGAVNSVIIGNNMPIPYAVGRTYSGGNLVFDDSGGADNIWRGQVRVFTAAGPAHSFEQFLADYAPLPLSLPMPSAAAATGFYNTFLNVHTKLGNRPEPGYSDSTYLQYWGAGYRTSGFASVKLMMRFDKDAKRFSGGVPEFGIVGRWVKIYDPRKDSTYPGGSGSHRWNDESTWGWSENPSLHALTYARGRFIEKNANGTAKVPPVKLLGCGFPASAIDMAVFVEGANLCEANGWTCGGTIYEAPGVSKWENLKRFCQAFAAQPVLTGGRLSLRLFSPRPSLFTITKDDLADGSCEIRAMKPFQDRRNTIVPRVRSEGHRWEYVQLQPVTNATYVTEDGGSRTEEVQYDLCQSVNQGAQLAAADLLIGRQLGPLTVSLKPRLMRYRPGEAGDVDLPELGLSNRRMVITARQVDPATGIVTLTLESEPSLDEYNFALGRTGVAPPTPVIRSPEEIDLATGALDSSGTTIVANEASVEVQFDSSGAKPGELPRDVGFRLMRNGSQLFDDNLWTYRVLTGSLNGKTLSDGPQFMSGVDAGTLTITSLGAAGASLEVSAARGQSKWTLASPFEIIRKDDVPGIGGGSSGGGTGGGTGTGGTMSQLSSFASTTPIGTGYGDSLNQLPNVRTGSTGRIDFTAPLTYGVSGVSEASVGLYGKWLYRLAGASTWLDAAAELAPTERADRVDISETFRPSFVVSRGSLSVTQSKTGLAADTEYEVAITLRDDSTTYAAIGINGTATATGG